MHDTLIARPSPAASPIAAVDAPVDRPGKISRRFWRFGIALAIAGLIFTVGCEVHRLRSGDDRLVFGHDLLPSYAAGVLVRQSQPRSMYDRQAIEVVETKFITRSRLDMDPHYGPWLNPPFYAWVFVPLAAMPYRAALAVFTAINLGILGCVFFMLRQFVVTPSIRRVRISGREGGALNTDARPTTLLDPRPLKRTLQGSFVGSGARTISRRISISVPLPQTVRGADPTNSHSLALIPLLLATSMPFMQAFGHQQNTFITLAILCLTITFWRQDRALMVGLVAGFLAYKPQHAVLICGALVVCVGWRALLGIGITGLFLLAITLLTMPGCLHDFFYNLPPIIHWLQGDARYNWGRQVTFQSFWRLLIQRDAAGESWMIVKVLAWSCSTIVALLLASAIAFWLRRRTTASSPDRVIAAVVVSAPLIVPYYMDYDLVLLALPAVLFARDWIMRPQSITRLDHWLLRAWVLLFVVTYVNPGFAREFHFNLAMPVLVVVALLHIARSLVYWEYASETGKTTR